MERQQLWTDPRWSTNMSGDLFLATGLDIRSQASKKAVSWLDVSVDDQPV